MKGVVIAVLLGSAAALHAGCDSSPIAPGGGTDSGGPYAGFARASVVTTGADLDRDGYLVRVDGGAQREIAVNGAVIFSSLATGKHTVTLDGAATNCTVDGDSARLVNVAAGDTAEVAFAITCSALIAGVWDWTEHFVNSACSDTGSYVFVGNGASYTGASQQVGVCYNPTRRDNTSGPDSVSEGVVAGDSTSFLVRRSCRYRATVSGSPSDRMSGTMTCGADTGTWEAVRGGRVVIALAPTTVELVAGDSLRIDDTLRDTAGHRVFFRPVTWTSDNPMVADVSPQGRVLARSRGNATITAAVEGATGVTSVRVVMPSSIAVTTATTGLGLGFAVRVSDTGPPLISPIGLNDRRNFPLLVPRSYRVALEALQENCRVTSENPQILTLTEGQSATVAITIACAPADQIAVSSDWAGTSVVYLSGAGWLVAPGGMDHAAWSPDGMRLAYSSHDFQDILVLDFNDLRITNLTGDSTVQDRSPTWSPDGSRIAFGRQGELYLINADGSGLVQVTHQTGFTRNPAWSPDGTTIAFECVIEGSYSDICVIHPDGTGFRRLTTDSQPDGGPGWSPDGSLIAFATCRYSIYCDIAVMHPDGTGVAPLLPGGAGAEEAEPTWSPDGTRISYASGSVCQDICYGNLYVMNADGTGRVTIVPLGSYTGVFGTAWRPRP